MCSTDSTNHFHEIFCTFFSAIIRTRYIDLRVKSLNWCRNLVLLHFKKYSCSRRGAYYSSSHVEGRCLVRGDNSNCQRQSRSGREGEGWREIVSRWTKKKRSGHSIFMVTITLFLSGFVNPTGNFASSWSLMKWEMMFFYLEVSFECFVFLFNSSPPRRGFFIPHGPLLFV